jgi:ATPase subunit of ABC transporter with duplicated ATPase domains
VTMLFEQLSGNLPIETGIIEWGKTITTTYLPLDNTEFFKVGEPIIDWLRDFVPAHVTDADEPFLRGFLGKMLFSGEEIFKKSNVLSGGEKVRCMISRMMLQNPNFLLLDQPTNHLDLESIQAFNESCMNFSGNIILSSHDQTFMQTVANRIIEITPNGVIDKLMSFDDFIASAEVKELREKMY